MRFATMLSTVIGFGTALAQHNTTPEHGPLRPTPPFNWEEVLTPPARTTSSKNLTAEISHNRLFGIFSTNLKPYEISHEANEFFKNYLQDAAALTSDAAVLRFASDSQLLDSGHVVELGTGTGRMTNFIAALNPEKVISSFDSFQGLPYPWERRDKTFALGTFSFKKGTLYSSPGHDLNQQVTLPTLRNVLVYQGLFKDVLPQFKAEILRTQPISLLLIDCDVYQSTKEGLELLSDHIVNGTIIVFDELYNYPSYEHHEWKAFQEFLASHRLTAEYLAFNRLHEQVAVRIIGPTSE